MAAKASKRSAQNASGALVLKAAIEKTLPGVSVKVTGVDYQSASKAALSVVLSTEEKLSIEQRMAVEEAANALIRGNAELRRTQLSRDAAIQRFGSLEALAFEPQDAPAPDSAGPFSVVEVAGTRTAALVAGECVRAAGELVALAVSKFSSKSKGKAEVIFGVGQAAAAVVGQALAQVAESEGAAQAKAAGAPAAVVAAGAAGAAAGAGPQGAAAAPDAASKKRGGAGDKKGDTKGAQEEKGPSLKRLGAAAASELLLQQMAEFCAARKLDFSGPHAAEAQRRLREELAPEVDVLLHSLENQAYARGLASKLADANEVRPVI